MDVLTPSAAAMSRWGIEAGARRIQSTRAQVSLALPCCSPGCDSALLGGQGRSVLDGDCAQMDDVDTQQPFAGGGDH